MKPARSYRLLLILTLLLVTGTNFIQAQKKKDLLVEIDTLKADLATTQRELTDARKKEAVSEARVTAIEAELMELRETNNSLLTNLNKIMEESSKKTESIGKSLESLQRKERQLREISDAMTHNDSTTLAILTDLKQTLGENAKIGTGNNVVVMVLENIYLFGEDDKSYSLAEEAGMYLEKVAAVLKKYPSVQLVVEGHSNALDFGKTSPVDNLELSSLRAIAVARLMSGTYEVAPERITAVGKGEEGLRIETTTQLKISPAFEDFYKSLKEKMKNQ